MTGFKFAFNRISTSFGKSSLSISRFAEIAGPGALLFVSYETFKMMALGRYDKSASFRAKQLWMRDNARSLKLSANRALQTVSEILFWTSPEQHLQLHRLAA